MIEDGEESHVKAAGDSTCGSGAGGTRPRHPVQRAIEKDDEPISLPLREAWEARE